MKRCYGVTALILLSSVLAFAQNVCTPPSLEIPTLKYKDNSDIKQAGGCFNPIDGTFQFNGTTPNSGGGASIVTPEKFGAKGDGVTDDTSAIQAAINAASTYGLGYWTPGDTKQPTVTIVQFSCKTYKTTSVLTLASSYVWIAGCGTRGGTVISQFTASSDIIRISGTGGTNTTAATGIKIYNITLMRGVPFSGTPVNLSLTYAYLFQGWNIESWDSYTNFKIVNTVSHVDWYNCYALDAADGTSTYGWNITGSQISSRWMDCLSTGAVYGFYLTNVGDAFFLRSENAATNVNSEGFHITGAGGNIQIIDPILEANTAIAAVNYTGGTEPVIINGGYMASGRTGLALSVASRIVISNVEIMEGGSSGSPPFAGVRFIGANNSDIVISNNYIIAQTSTTDGIYLDTSSTHNVISGNHITSASGATAIHLVGATRNAITGNQISGTFVNGITMDATSNNNAVSGNSIDPTSITNPLTDAGTGNQKAANAVL